MFYIMLFFSHHIGVVTPRDQVVHHYDTTGITCDHLTTDRRSQWMRAILVPFSNPVHQESDQAISDLELQDEWSAERCV